MTPLEGGLVIAAAGVLLTGFFAWVKWSMRTAVRQTIHTAVNGKIDKLQADVSGLVSWTEGHDDRHARELRQLNAALKRQGIDPADGLDVA